MMVLPSEVLISVAFSTQEFWRFGPLCGSIAMLVLCGMLCTVVVWSSRLVKVGPFEVASRCGRTAGALMIRCIYPAVDHMLGRRVAQAMSELPTRPVLP